MFYMFVACVIFRIVRGYAESLCWRPVRVHTGDSAPAEAALYVYTILQITVLHALYDSHAVRGTYQFVVHTASQPGPARPHVVHYHCALADAEPLLAILVRVLQ